MTGSSCTRCGLTPPPARRARGASRGSSSSGEDPATGSAAGPLVRLPPSSGRPSAVRVRQGEEMGRPSVLEAEMVEERERGQRAAQRDRRPADRRHRGAAGLMAAGVDRAEARRVDRARARAVRRGALPIARALRGGPREPAGRGADELDDDVAGRPPDLRGRGPGRVDHRRRRQHLRGSLPRRHRRDGGPRARGDGGCRRRPLPPRRDDDAADRGRGLGRGRARAPLRPAAVAAHADGHRRQPLRDPHGPPDHRPAEDRWSSATATTAPSTRRSSSSGRTGAVLRARGTSGRRSIRP